MEKETGTMFAIVLCIVALIVGGFLGATLYSTESTVEVEVEKIVNVPVEVIREVEVEVEKIVETTIELSFEDYKQNAVSLSLEEYLEDADLDRYQEAYVSKVGDKWSIELDDKKEKVIVYLELTFKVLDELEDTRTTETLNVKVIFEEDEDPRVKFL